MNDLKKTQVYENLLLNEHLGSLKFAYSTWQSSRRENIHSTSRNDKYTYSSIIKIVTATGANYELSKWIDLLKAKVSELKEEFIVNELVEVELKNGKKFEDAYIEALKVYCYRFWETSTEKHWQRFSSMLKEKYATELSQCLINTQSTIINSDTSNNIQEDSVLSQILKPFNLDIEYDVFDNF